MNDHAVTLLRPLSASFAPPGGSRFAPAVHPSFRRARAGYGDGVNRATLRIEATRAGCALAVRRTPDRSVASPQSAKRDRKRSWRRTPGTEASGYCHIFPPGRNIAWFLCPKHGGSVPDTKLRPASVQQATNARSRTGSARGRGVAACHKQPCGNVLQRFASDGCFSLDFWAGKWARTRLAAPKDHIFAASKWLQRTGGQQEHGPRKRGG